MKPNGGHGYPTSNGKSGMKNRIKLVLKDALEQIRWRKTGLLRFRCNICGRHAYALPARLTREEPTCRCGSTVRQRALMRLLSLELFGQVLALSDFPKRPDIVGIDMSGADIYSEKLSKSLAYTNTFFHKPPQLDISNPNPRWLGQCDFIISSDVFEHVAPPVSRAFENTLHLLKFGGVFIFTVPYAKTGMTVEHFPDLHNYHLDNRNGKQVLVNLTADGQKQEFDQLVFHGGEGETLEMRVFSESGVQDELRRAGFSDIRIHGQSCPEFGIYWPQDWSLPISARRPKN